MASIVDPFGHPVSSRILHASQGGRRNRPYWPSSLQDNKSDIPFIDWRTAVSYSRRLYANDGLVKGAIDNLAQHAIGRAWNPQYTGRDAAWGKDAQRWLEEEWFGVCDVRGENFDFKTNLFNDSVALDTDGDFAFILTETEGGYPQTQHIPAHKIGQRDYAETVVKKGPLAGYSITHGIITNKFGRCVGIRVLGDTEKDDRDEIASNIGFCFNATRADQVRGLPAFAHAINELRDAWQAQQYEQITHQLASSISLVETNETGGIDPNDPTVSLGYAATESSGAGITTQMYDGGLIRYLKSNSGAKLEEFASNKPGADWESFQDRIIRKALVGMGWPYSLSWKSENLKGPAERSQIELARVTIMDRQDLLSRVALRQIRYALAKAMKSGIIAKSSDWWRWTFTMPAKFSIDHGRDGISRREDYLLGLRNMSDILGELGGNLETHSAQRKSEISALIKDAQDISAQSNVPFGLALSLLQQRTSTGAVGGGVIGTLVDAAQQAVENAQP